MPRQQLPTAFGDHVFCARFQRRLSFSVGLSARRTGALASCSSCRVCFLIVVRKIVGKECTWSIGHITYIAVWLGETNLGRSHYNSSNLYTPSSLCHTLRNILRRVVEVFKSSARLTMKGWTPRDQTGRGETIVSRRESVVKKSIGPSIRIGIKHCTMGNYDPLGLNE